MSLTKLNRDGNVGALQRAFAGEKVMTQLYGYNLSGGKRLGKPRTRTDGPTKFRPNKCLSGPVEFMGQAIAGPPNFRFTILYFRHSTTLHYIIETLISVQRERESSPAT
ncbi:hypothetical protein AKJ16_DCAP03660 [Drosera capensis]